MSGSSWSAPTIPACRQAKASRNVSSGAGGAAARSRSSAASASRLGGQRDPATAAAPLPLAKAQPTQARQHSAR